MIMRGNFCLFCIKTYVVTRHLNHLHEMVQMTGHNIWFLMGKVRKIIIKYSLLSRALLQIQVFEIMRVNLVASEYLMIMRGKFCLFCIKAYVVTPHLNRLNETVQMRGHNIWFRCEIRKIIIKYSLLSRALLQIQVFEIMRVNLVASEYLMIMRGNFVYSA